MWSVLLLLAGIGMITVGVFAIVFWRVKKKTPLRLFLFGGLLWALAIAIKLIMDLFIMQPVWTSLSTMMPYLYLVLIASAFLGLRTGLFESGITYLAARWAGWSKMSLDDAIGVGIGFGAAEAILLGIYSLLVTTSIISLSDFSISQELIIAIILPISERAFVLLCHVFATALAILATRPGGLWMLLASIGIKTLLDSAIPIGVYLATPYGVNGTIALELYVALIGIISLAGLIWLRKMKGAADAPKAGN